MQIVGNKALLLKVRNTDKITTVIPKSKVVAPNKVLIHWGFEECKVLGNLGIKGVPAPILRKYSWPGVHKPYEHQKEIAAFLSMNRKAFCFAEAGTGKTSSAIWAADYLMDLGIIKRVLIVCPLSIMDAAWRSDLFKTVMHREVVVAYHRTSNTRKEIIRDTQAQFVIMNYDGVEIVQAEIKAKKFDLIIVDEANYLAKTTTKRFKTFTKLLEPTTWLWMMTGTPAAQSPTDAYGLAKLVSPEKVPKFFGSFRDMVMFKVNQFKWLPRANAKDVVFAALQPAIRHTKEECLDLPPLTYTYREAPLTPQQKKYFKIMKEQFTINAAGGSITAVNAAINIGKLIQIAGGCAYSTAREVIEFDCSTRFEVLKEVLEGTPNKVLLFVEYTHMIDRLKDSLTKEKYEVAVIDGRTTKNHRAEICSAFQYMDKYKVLILHPKAAAHGLTLTKADTVVYWTPISSVEAYLQCNARIDRIGQTNKTTVVQIYGCELERKRYKILEERVDFHESVVDLYKETMDE